jgi:hypothetical protein
MHPITMHQVILLESYLGLSGFTYLSSCTGKALSIEEVKSRKLTTDEDLHNYRKSDYDFEWYEITSGDTITIVTNEETFVFEVPDTVIHDIQQRLDEIQGPPRSEVYLAKYCKRIT